jgi:ABC-type transporter Mla maintaining outer membrane lipid asymmetry ATPase subunit MlaF
LPTTANDSITPEPSAALAIETHGLTKRFGERTALDGIDLQVPTGCAFGFLGPNGAGKTTIIRTLLGLTHANAGTMQILGRPVPAERAAALQRVGAIVEEPRFHMHLTGRENLRTIAAVRGPEVDERIAPALARVGLTDRADQKVKSYSMGMRQRLGVARCLLADPLLLILDEPTNGRAGGPHRLHLLPPARRGRKDLRLGGYRRPRQNHHPGPDRRARQWRQRRPARARPRGRQS